MNEYEAQLVAVEQALKNATDEQQREELSALRTNLQELLALTRETETDQTAQEGDILDDELLRLKSELNELEEAAATVGATKNEDEEQQLADLRAKYNALIGEKCSAPHEHSWGAVSYHNALICGVDDEVIINSNAVLDVRLRVLYINPTHCEMLPCNYYLEGECRFDEIRCRYSHGALVPGASIKSYIPPDFPRLARNCPVLAKMPDRLWHRGRVLCANFVEQTCRVRLDGQDHKERERDFQFEELYPLIAEEEDEMTSEDSTSSLHDGSSDEIESDMDDLEAAHRSRMVELSLFTFKPTEKLGAWEQYTRGIGSKLMEKMGYIHGTGLGSEGRGIVTPVSAQILPQGRSLDACMELREAANGDKDYFSVERKLKRAQRRQNKANEKAYVRETQRTDVFSFLNGSVLGGSGKSGQQAEQAAKNTKTSDLQQHSTKTLNVETVRVADDIRRKQRDIAKVKQSLDRNATDVQLQKRLHMQLQSQKQELATLQAHEHRLSKEQNTRKNKMFEF